MVDINKWKESDINVDSLWLIDKRDSSGKHSNISNINIFIEKLMITFGNALSYSYIFIMYYIVLLRKKEVYNEK